VTKVRETKKQRVKKLLKQLEAGQSFDLISNYDHPDVDMDFMRSVFKDNYEIWASTWIIPEVKKLLAQYLEKPVDRQDGQR
jgi:hypothetical protein